MQGFTLKLPLTLPSLFAVWGHSHVAVSPLLLFPVTLILPPSPHFLSLNAGEGLQLEFGGGGDLEAGAPRPAQRPLAFAPSSCHALALAWTFSYLLFFRALSLLGLPTPTPFTNAVQLLLTLKVSLRSGPPSVPADLPNFTSSQPLPRGLGTGLFLPQVHRLCPGAGLPRSAPTWGKEVRKVMYL